MTLVSNNRSEEAREGAVEKQTVQKSQVCGPCLHHEDLQVLYCNQR